MLLLLSACDTGIKQAGGQGLGESCLELECERSLVCSHDGVCQNDGDVGSVTVGGDCSSAEECAWGLVCAGDNTCAEPGNPGTGDDGAECSDDADCQAGFWCDGGACADLGIPYWEGGACPDDIADGDFYPLFEVPDLPAYNELDFFALPFPNDARLSNDGRPDISGFPTPSELAPTVDALIAAVEGGPTGWGTNPVVYFRFNREVDPDSLEVLSDDATIWFVSLDEEADDYGPLSSVQYFTRSARGRYICQNWLAVTTGDGHPLLPDHTYAVWLTDDIEDLDDDDAVRAEGFSAMMRDDRPDDSSVENAWDAYTPLREYVDREDLDAAEIVGAAVFTTGQPARGVRYFRELLVETPPTVADLTLCDAGVASACGDGGDRECGSAEAGFAELHGVMNLSNYRDATGAVSREESGLQPQVQGEEGVCFALTVPAGDAPEGGWPLTVVVPDVGGTFRDAIADGTAAELAAAGIATISVELPGEGVRENPWPDAENPAGWLGGQVQAVSDAHAAIALAETWSVTAEESPTTEALSFDAGNIWLWGIGEGGSVAIDVLAWSLEARGGVIGNPEGLRIHALVERTQRVDIARPLQAAYADSNLTRWHPVLALHQQLLDPADPVNHLLGVVREPAFDAKHLFVVHGVDDVELSMESVAAPLLAGSIPTAGDVLEDYGQSTTDLPATENANTDDGQATAACVQTSSGHDALTEEQDRGAAFIASGLDGGAPTIE